MQIKPLKSKYKKYLIKHQLENKFTKQAKTFENNPKHPSLHTELLEPKSEGVYSFRIDRKYRVQFIITDGEVEVVDINDHYQ